MSNYSSIKIWVRIRSTNGDILDCLFFNCAVIICGVTKSMLFSFCKISKKTTFSFFQSFFLGKLSKSRFLKLNISRTALRILTILVSFCGILNGLLDEIKSFFNPKSTEHWGGSGGFFTSLCNIRSRHPRKLKFTGLIAYSLCYVLQNMQI